jgi:hypothetical protein
VADSENYSREVLASTIEWRSVSVKTVIAELYPQSPRHFARQPSARVSQNLGPSYPNHMTTAATYADQ